MQNEGNLFDEHARLLSTFASELSSFASTLSFQSHEYYAQSDQLNRLAGKVMAGGPAMKFDLDSDTHYHVVVAQVTRQAVRTTETIDVRSSVWRTLHNLTKMRADQIPEVRSEEQQATMRDCQSALENPLNSGHAFAAVCRMAFVMGEGLRAERGSALGKEDIEVADVIVEEYSRRKDVMEDAVTAFAASKEHFRSLTRGESSKEKVQEQLSGSCSPISINSEEEQAEDAMHTFKPYGHMINSVTTPPRLREREFSSAPEETQALPALGPDWKLWSDSWEDEDESADWPIDKPFYQNSDNDESDIYSSDLPSYEEAMIILDPVQEECDHMAEFQRNPYDLATRTDSSGNPPLPGDCGEDGQSQPVIWAADQLCRRYALK